MPEQFIYFFYIQKYFMVRAWEIGLYDETLQAVKENILIDLFWEDFFFKKVL